MSKLARLRLHNFKGKQSEWAIAPKMLLVGPNGAGKSAVLQAVMVGILGYEPRLGRTPASVVQLASGREMSVEIETDAKFILHRTFKLSRGAVSTSVWVSPHQGEKNLADAHRRIAEEVGDFAVSFDLNAFLSLSDAKKRAFLFGLSPTKGLGWEKTHLKSRLIQSVRAPVSSLTLHAWIDKAFALWTEGHDLQSNFDRMLIYLKKEFSLWSLRKKEGVAAARQMLHTRNQEPFIPSEATRTTQREIEEIQERIILIREELAKDEARRKSAEARGREIEGLRARLTEWEATAASVEKIQEQIAELRSRTFDRAPMQQERHQVEQATAALFSEIEQEEKRLNALKIALEVEKKGLDRAESIHGICPVVEGIECPVDFTPVIAQGRDRLSVQEGTILEIETMQTLRWQRYRELQESLGQLRARTLLMDEEERETEKQIVIWEEMLRQSSQGEGKQAELLKVLSRLEAEEGADGGYADPNDLILQKEGLERHLEVLKRRLAEQEERRSLWIAYQQNQVDLKKADANVEALKQLIVALGPKGLQGEMIKEMIRPFSKIVNDLLHAIDPEKEWVFGFQDLRGNEIFEMGWKRGEQFIPFEALSTGERVLFSAALMTALILFRGPNCRLLLVDNLESVDLHHRRRFIEALCAFVDEGHLDHFIVAGVEGIPPGDAARLGVKMIQMADPAMASA